MAFMRMLDLPCVLLTAIYFKDHVLVGPN